MIETRSRRAKLANDRREEILWTALHLFATQGFRATTIADIASATETAHGLLYHYFRSKDELLLAILERYSFLAELRQVLSVAPDRPAGDVLLEIAGAFSRMLDQRRELLQLVIAESQTNGAVADALAAVAGEGERLLVAYLEARIAAGELRSHDPSVPARALFWALITEHLGPRREDGFDTALVALLLDGIRAH